MTSNKPTIFSGVQPSGQLTIGNYIGAVSKWVEIQDQYNSIFCVVDLHAITTPQDPKELNARIIEITKHYLACGINPNKSIIFQQSAVAEHSELAWILNTIATMSELEKMTQYKLKAGLNEKDIQHRDIKSKMSHATVVLHDASNHIKNQSSLIKEMRDILHSENNNVEDELRQSKKTLLNMMDKVMEYLKSQSKEQKSISKTITDLLDAITILEKFINKKNTGVGLFDYPVLMAADILLYNTDQVPVGDDQVQHVELCRDLAKRFNHQFGETFKIPEVIIRKEGARIMALDDPTKKMSKSSSSPASYIALLDEPSVAAKKIMRATTDTEATVKYDKENKPGISNLLTIHSFLSGKTIKQLEKDYDGKGYGDFKKDLAELVKDFLTAYQQRYNSYTDQQIKELLKDGAEKLKPLAQKTLNQVKEKIGFNI
jgi:tryptophanyl-tRNA synthetase